MRKIIVTEFITLDGVVEAPGGNETDHPHAGWQFKFSHPEAGQYKVDELNSVDTLLLGRKTYDQFSAYWPNETGAFADPINRMPKYIVSNTLELVTWYNSHLIHDVAKDVAELKRGEGGNILVYGSATLVQSLIRHDLVDELRLMVFPIIVGGGLRIFQDDRSMKKFTLQKSVALDNGVLILEYIPVHI